MSIRICRWPVMASYDCIANSAGFQGAKSGCTVWPSQTVSHLSCSHLWKGHTKRLPESTMWSVRSNDIPRWRWWPYTWRDWQHILGLLWREQCCKY
jgi:hypothetical protein